MIVALSGGQKLGLFVVAAIFIGFALASSFLFPRSNPDFPSPRLRLFIAVSIGLMIAMLAAMAVFAREGEEEEGGHAAEPAAQAEETTPGETQAGEGAPTEGDAAAGKQVFASAGCGGCHTLSDAGSSGNVGPNLDESQPDHALVVDRVTNGQGGMPSFKDQLSAEDIQNVAAYVSETAGGT